MTTLTIPSALYDTACAIAQALDTDSGGYFSYGPKDFTDATGGTFIPDSYTTSGTFGREKSLLKELLCNFVKLHEFVFNEYVTRFSNLVAPSLEDCRYFCENVTVTFTDNLE